MALILRGSSRRCGRQVPATRPGEPARSIATDRPLGIDDVGLLAVLNDPELRSEQGQVDVAQANLLQSSLLPNPAASVSFTPLLGGDGRRAGMGGLSHAGRQIHPDVPHAQEVRTIPGAAGECRPAVAGMAGCPEGEAPGAGSLLRAAVARSQPPAARPARPGGQRRAGRHPGGQSRPHGARTAPDAPRPRPSRRSPRSDSRRCRTGRRSMRCSGSTRRSASPLAAPSLPPLPAGSRSAAREPARPSSGPGSAAARLPLRG